MFVVPNQLFLLSKHYEVEIKSILLVVSEPFHSPLHHFTLHANHHNMNEPTLISLENLVVVGKNPPGKPADEGGNAWIKEIRGNGVKVRFTIDNRVRIVSPQRIIRSAHLDTFARQRNCDGRPRASLLSVNHAIKQRESNTNIETRAPGQMTRTIYKKLMEAQQWKPSSKSKLSPLMTYLKKGREKPFGWLRQEEADACNKTVSTNKQKVFLDEAEKNLLIKIRQHTEQYSTVIAASRAFSPTKDLAHAFGVGVSVVKACISKQMNNNGSTKRKQRSDAGETLIKSYKKQCKIWSPRHYFIKQQTILNGQEVFTREEIDTKFNSLSSAERRQCEDGAERMKNLLLNIEEEIANALGRTNGTVGWEIIAELIAGGPGRVQPVNKVAIAEFVMSQEGSRYTATKLQPTLTSYHKTKRLKWAINFHLFWEGAKLLKTKTQFMSVHLDEKWFYCLVVRSFNKLVPYFGISPTYHNQHTKNSAEKILCISTVGFLPKDNDPRKGGRSFLLDFTRAGQYEIANCDTYRRVYRDDGTYSMPRIPANRLRTRGQEYFVDTEITGSRREHGGKKKFPMLDFFRDTLLPKFDAIAEELSRELNKKIVIRYQHDNASPHVEKQFKQWLEQQFAQRDWFIANQPPCSPTCNVNDAYLFPGLSKKVTRTQGVDFSGRTLKKEELWLLAKNEFERYSLEKLSSAFVQNEQVACAIAGDKGGNEHTKVKGAMHFNIRKTCLPWYSNSDDGDSGPVEDENGNVRVRKAIGVHVAEEYEIAELPTNRQGQALKYDRHNTKQYNTQQYREYLTRDELELINNGAMEVANEGNVPDDFDWDVFGRFFDAVEAEGNDEE